MVVYGGDRVDPDYPLRLTSVLSYGLSCTYNDRDCAYFWLFQYEQTIQDYDKAFCMDSTHSHC